MNSFYMVGSLSLLSHAENVSNSLDICCHLVLGMVLQVKNTRGFI